MASVTNLDNDVNSKRGDRVTPATVNEVRNFIEESLGEKLPDVGDDPRFGTYNILAALKDGVALCKLAALIDPAKVRGFKPKATMPFIQRENIALFLAACEKPPLGLHAHDRFLTVDLYDGKDPAQVLQCLATFSRAANRVEPSKFPNPIGAKSRGGVVSPQVTGQYLGTGYGNRAREASTASTASSSNKPASTLTASRTGGSDSGRKSPSRFGRPTSPGSVSTWSKKSDEGATAPAWNIAQYGYMGGASQGSMGVSFGGRRQITNAGPSVPSLAEKEKKRREKEAEDARLKLEAEQQAKQRVAAEEEKARIQEEKRFAEETEKLRQKTLNEKREWEEQERKWKAEEDRRKQDEAEAENRAADERKRLRGTSDARLQGQFLSQYQAENDLSKKGRRTNSTEADRIRQLEHELAEARDRERRYQAERVSKHKTGDREAIEDHDLTLRLKEETSKARPESGSPPSLPPRKDSDETWRKDERDYLRKQWSSQNTSEDTPPPIKSARPLPEPTVAAINPEHTGGARTLPDPVNYTSPTSKVPNRTDRFLSSNPPPTPPRPTTTYSNEIGTFSGNAERDAEDRRRVESQTKTKAAEWASKSLLEKEMEMERQRQQEWEESQKEVKSKVPVGDGVDGIGGGIGGKWDVNQWTGYTGGDGQNKGTQGIGAGRRQIVGQASNVGR
ncbi:29b80904-6658-4ae5-ae57-ab9f51431cfa [Sclerotinia trifoliorum]|uniref:29b80904-6658-4ae5-ae57-ab9f51431cfa n=1 Tax=Sclerotinia trifoliorum TaxID=28548 RepID=A0A8H2ZLS5_9HELO|nr:29b80904-6658-4ae5-ae57-ab9f51431cfa [Sclerotinia trifoliorum]